MRSDSFPRPLEHTLITDFFGGVAQAEVLPPDTDSLASAVESPTLMSEAVDHSSNRIIPSETHPEVAGVSSVLMKGSGIMRAWGSICLVGLLVGWVAVGKT